MIPGDRFVPWLGVLPDAWKIRPLKHAVRFNPDVLGEDTDPATLIRYVDISTVDSQGRIGNPEEMTFFDAPSRARRVVRSGDVIVSTVRTYLTAISRIDADGLTVSTGFAVLRPRAGVDSRFLGYWMRSQYIVDEIVARSTGVSYPATNPTEIGQLPFPTINADEQRAIADFLDREIAGVDELAQCKRSLLTKLEEERVAVVARAVTKGLPAHAASAAGFTPNPRLKQTDVDWLGEVPDHWEISQLKWVVHFQRGHDLPSESREQGQVPVVSSAGLIGRHSAAAAKGPGIITGRYGSIGEFYLIEQDYWPLNTTLHSTSLRGNDPHFVVRMLANLAPLFLLNAVKSAVPGVDRNDIHPVLTAVPPLNEQTAIAAYLDREEARIRGVVAKVEAAIRALNDYRSALISAAVTGQIDVRNYRPQEAAALCQ